MTFSTSKVILTDYQSAMAATVCSATWVYAFLDQGILHSPAAIIFLIIVTGPLLPLLIWRIRRVSRLCSSGRAVEARIVRIWRGGYIRGATEIDFAFEHEGECIRTEMFLMGWKSVLALKRGQTVEVLYDPMHPKRAIVKQFFQA